ncbi:MAG: protein kinase, partial [Planctomycetaceae bacterium]
MSTVLSEREGASLEPELCAIMERLKADAPLESVTSTGCTHRESHTILSEMDAFIQQLVNESGGMPRIGHYELGEKIGRGGMGAVYRATDRKLNRQVAIKFLKPDLTRDPVFVERFEREAQAAAGIIHPHVVTVHGIEETNGIPWIVMEFVEG